MNAKGHSHHALFREQLERLLASETFQGSISLRRLLSYLGEVSLAGKSEGLKEYTVGVDGLGRSPDYDPRIDASVRVLKGKLQRKIQEYYAKEGAADPVRIEVPKGGFQLNFSLAAAVNPAARHLRRWKTAGAVLSVVVLVLSAAVLLLCLRNRASRLEAAVEWNAGLEALWRPFLDNDTPILISFGSPLFISIPDWTIRNPFVNDWQTAPEDPRFVALRKKLSFELARPVYSYAGVGDVNGVFLLCRLLFSRKSQILLKRGAVLAWEDIRNNHLVFIGGGKSNEKLRDILADRDFVIEPERVVNRRPAAGEVLEYPSVREPYFTEFLEEHILITCLPGYSDRRRILILAAYSNPGVWAAVEAVTHPDYARELVGHLLKKDGTLPSAFQAVLKVHFNAQVPVRFSYVTHHALKNAKP